MKDIFYILLIGFITMSFQLKDTEKPNNTEVVVNVQNVQHHQGNIKAVLYNRSNFLTEKFVECIEIPMANATTNTAQMIFKNLPQGEYAVAIYHDLNENNNFDRNWIGYPKEPFAMSNNIRPYNLLLPSFDKAKFYYNNQPIKLNIDLLNN